MTAFLILVKPLLCFTSIVETLTSYVYASWIWWLEDNYIPSTHYYVAARSVSRSETLVAVMSTGGHAPPHSKVGRGHSMPPQHFSQKSRVVKIKMYSCEEW